MSYPNLSAFRNFFQRLRSLSANIRTSRLPARHNALYAHDTLSTFLAGYIPALRGMSNTGCHPLPHIFRTATTQPVCGFNPRPFHILEIIYCCNYWLSIGAFFIQTNTKRSKSEVHDLEEAKRRIATN